jgi:hypothetical protein
VVSAMCSVPSLTFSVACGHNAGVWLFVSIPLGAFVCWITLSALARHYRKPQEPNANANDA